MSSFCKRLYLAKESSGPFEIIAIGSVLMAMGAARSMHARWRGALKATLLVSTGTSVSFVTKRNIRCDSGRDTAEWPAKSRSTPAINHPENKTLANNEPSPAQSKSPDDTKDGKSSNDGESTESGSAWDKLAGNIGIAKDSLSATDWSDVLKDYITPGWTYLLPETLQNLQVELSMGHGSLADEVWSEAHDPSLNPEIARGSRVRIGEGLCREEQDFQRRRRHVIAQNLASYLGLDEEVHPDDVPIIAMSGSGGGLRALVAGNGSYLAAKEAGLWDCVTYSAGVSGSCWLQTLYNTSLGRQDFHKVLDHLKARLGIHLASLPEALSLLTNPPTNKYLLRGTIEKLKGDSGSDFGVVDIYGLLLAARLLVPEGNASLFDSDLKLSAQRRFIDSGAHPLPIYTAVRHEIPKISSTGKDGEPTPEKLKEIAKQESWFQWFEFSPYELFCEEFSAGIPSWAVGRHFKDGKDVPLPHGYSIPELRIPGLMGVWGSAFCATLAHYYKEIRPALRGIAGFNGIDSLIEGKNEDLTRVHPIDPATIPNFVLGMKDKLPKSCPESIFEDSHLRLMDAGMSNNLPIYPLLREGRGVDLIISFDASADVRDDNWLSVVDGYARKRGVKGWPVGVGWPKASVKPEETAATLEREETVSKHVADLKVARARDTAKGISATLPDGEEVADDLTYCNIWVGTRQEQISSSEPPPSTRLFHSHEKTDKDSDFRLMQPNAGIAVAYFPFIPNAAAPVHWPKPEPTDKTDEANPSKNPTSKADQDESPSHLDPAKDEFLSTWNFVYTPEQIDSVVALAKANFAEGEDQLKRVVRGIYERKKRERLRKNLEMDRRNISYLS